MPFRARERIARSDEWNFEQRGEGPMQRADRNFVELLQELRVMQTGVQVLFAMLLTVAFTAQFQRADTVQRLIYVVALCAAALAIGMLIAPVAHHRRSFQYGRKPAVVATSHRFARAGLVGLFVAVSGSLLLVLDVALGRITAIVVTAALAALLVAMWFAFPVPRTQSDPHHGAGTHANVDDDRGGTT